MLAKISWKNIWRNPVRSFVVIGAVIMGIWALLFLMSFSNGLISSYIKNSIQNETSHLQIHHPEFHKDKEIKYIIPEAIDLENELRNDPMVKSVARRTLCNGMASSAKGGRGVMIKGIDPEKEIEVTGLDGKVTQGKFFDTKKKNPILIGEKLAEKLKLKLRSKIVLTFQDAQGEIVAGAFRIVGLYKTGNTRMDELNVYVKDSDLSRLLNMENSSHEIALVLKDFEQTKPLAAEWKKKYPELLVEHYGEISPDLDLFQEQIKINMSIFIFIVMLALIFGIINTMLMAVLERMRELGMLMAIGMNKIKVFGMIVMETIMLALIGAPIGMLFGFLTIRYFNNRGIDLTSFSEGLEQFGMDNFVRPEIGSDFYIQIAIAIFITAVLASIYPALRAIRLKPVEALRKI